MGETESNPLGGALADAISAASEEFYCAGWLIDCEYALWARVLQYRATGMADGWGLGSDRSLTATVRKLDALADAAGGWVAWFEDGGERFVPWPEWERLWSGADAHYRNLAEAVSR